MITLILIDPKGQSFISPGMIKHYANQEFKVYKSSFEGHDYVIYRRCDKACAIVKDYRAQQLQFDHKLHAKFKD